MIDSQDEFENEPQHVSLYHQNEWRRQQRELRKPSAGTIPATTSTSGRPTWDQVNDVGNMTREQQAELLRKLGEIGKQAMDELK